MKLVEKFNDFNWEKIEEEVWNPKTKPLISGRIKEIHSNKYDKHDVLITTFEGLDVLVFGKTMIDKALQKFGVGDYICIEYKGDEDIGKGNALEMYEISKGERK